MNIRLKLRSDDPDLYLALVLHCVLDSRRGFDGLASCAGADAPQDTTCYGLGFFDTSNSLSPAEWIALLEGITSTVLPVARSDESRRSEYGSSGQADC